MKEEETWQGDDWEFGRPSEEPSHTQTHNCSQSCANELAVTTHLGGYQHALIELADALTRHRCSTSLPQCHNAGRGSRRAKPRSRLPCQKANRERPQPPNSRNRTMGSFSSYLLTLSTSTRPLYSTSPGQTLVVAKPKLKKNPFNSLIHCGNAF